MAQFTDVAIQATSGDASTCKKYAVKLGYWKDSYVNLMVHGNSSRKQPEISRGYYARTESIWQILNKFITLTKNNCQIVSLGAGLDTTFWRLFESSNLPSSYVEVDFKDVCGTKIRCMGQRPKLLECLKEVVSNEDRTCLHCQKYHLVHADLRNLNNLEQSLNSCNLDKSLPTLFLTECVLIYMTPENSFALLKWSASQFTDAVFLNYEQVNMNDNFGQVMIQNLKARQCLLAGAEPCKTIESQVERFLNAKWENISCQTMWTVYNGLKNKRKIEQIEMLDEQELLQQLLEHYCLCIAVKDISNLGLQSLI